MQLNVYDMDNTLIDSADIVQQCQLEGLLRATENRDSNIEYSKLYLSHALRTGGIKNILSQLNIDSDTFYKEYYKTFNPFEAAKKGEIKVFEDVRAFFDKGGIYFDFYHKGMCPSDKRPFSVDAVVSNSSRSATIDKLDAFDIREHINYIFAEFEKAKAKPTPYMAIQLLERLKDTGDINKIDKIINVGDTLVDIEFGRILYDTLAAKMYRKPEFSNYLVDRRGIFNPIHDVHVIKSFMEIQNE